LARRRNEGIAVGDRAGLRLAARALLPAAALSLGACLYVGPTGSHYEPSYPSSAATVRHDPAGGFCGPAASLRLPLHDNAAVLNAQLVEQRGRRLELRLRLALRPGSRARFQGRTILLHDPDEGRDWRIEDARVAVSQMLPPWPVSAERPLSLELLAPTAADALPGDASAEASWRAVLPGIWPERIRVQPPPLLVDGQRIDPPPLMLAADAAERAARIADAGGPSGSWWWPYHLQAPVEAPLSLAPGLALSIRATATHLALDRVQGVEVELQLRFGPGRQWRLAEPRTLVGDPSSGQQWSLPVERLSLRYDPFRLPLDAVMHARGSPAWPELAMLQASGVWQVSERALPGLDVQLPAIEIDGELIELAPLRFKRQLSVGVVPLNC